MEDKKELLEKLKEEMESDRALPLYGTANFVFGEGDIDAKVMFIGEGPGFHEDRLSRPFVGRAGQLLDRLLAMISWPRESVYITNILKRRPPENRDPLPEEVAAYGPYLKRQIESINPKIIAALGRFAMNYFLPEAKISKDHGQAAWAGEYLILPLYHPAAALRSTQVLKDLEADFKKLPEILKNPPPKPPPQPKKEEEAQKQESLF
ncbi:MAG: uracil-DNA glycosylase [Candidatus Niyogibacteria bacterium]|nr:uracil-DNA glycosylase [Candidatus Niyogibacteria bacterium]